MSSFNLLPEFTGLIAGLYLPMAIQVIYAFSGLAELGSKVHREPRIRQLPDPDPATTGSRSGNNRINRLLLGRDPAKPDPDPDFTGQRSGETGSRHG